MLTFDRVSKSYNGGETWAVNQLTLEIQDGEIFGLLGPNGAGKSTLIKMLTGVIEADEGRIVINGQEMKDGNLAAKREFCYCPDSPDHLLRLTGLEYANFISDIYGVDAKERSERIQKLAKDLEIDSALGQQIQSYSHGMRQKMMLLGALLPNPNLWVLDEPMTGLDPKSAFWLKEKMREHSRAGNTVLFSTHVLDVAERLVDRVGVISKGRLIFVGTIDELRKQRGEQASLEDLFLELTEDDASSGFEPSAAPATHVER